MNKSELKEAIKNLVRESLNEKCGGGHLAGGAKGKRMFKHIKAGYKGEKDPEDAERIAAATVNKNLDEAGLTSEKKGKKWIQKAVDPKHKGYCTPMTKPTCTPRRKALAKRFKKGLEELLQRMNEKERLVEGGPQYKVVSPTQARCSKCNQALTMQYDPKMTENVEEAGQNPFFDKINVVIQIIEKASDMIDSNPQMAKHALKSVVRSLKGGGMNEASYKQVSPNETDTAIEDKARTIQTEPKVTENHKVQHRSAATVNDLPNDPNNVRDPENPISNGA